MATGTFSAFNQDLEIPVADITELQGCVGSGQFIHRERTLHSEMSWTSRSLIARRTTGLCYPAHSSGIFVCCEAIAMSCDRDVALSCDIQCTMREIPEFDCSKCSICVYLSLRMPSRMLNPLASAHISTPFRSRPRTKDAHSMLADI